MCPHCILLGTLAALGAIPLIGGFFLILRVKYKAWRDEAEAKLENP